MNDQPQSRGIMILVLLLLLTHAAARAATIEFFNPSQPVTVVASNINDGTLSSSGYLFTYTADGYWSASPGGTPTGRFFSVFWPGGVQAQALTAGPDVGAGANITLSRLDGRSFGLSAFTGRLLANTAATGGAFEIMPKIAGEDALPDPLMFDASGYAGMAFQHTPALSGYDSYVIHLWVDWAIVELAVVDDVPLVSAGLHISSTPAIGIQLSWPADAVGYVLEQATALPPGGWGPVTNRAQLVGTNVVVTVQPSKSAQYFRLRASN